jgi:hypothetical protein
MSFTLLGYQEKALYHRTYNHTFSGKFQYLIMEAYLWLDNKSKSCLKNGKRENSPRIEQKLWRKLVNKTI